MRDRDGVRGASARCSGVLGAGARGRAALLLAIIAGVVAGAGARPALANDPLLCDAPGEAPDVIAGAIQGVVRYGPVAGITAYSIGTDGCNVGTCRMTWTGATAGHPIIGQNMFRLKDGRFEQIGQSWVKHVFASDQGVTCSNACIPSPTSDHLGVNCSDLYTAPTNGLQTRLGPKWEIDPHAGTFPYPTSEMSKTGNAIFKRLQVHNGDLDPFFNPGAQYVMEAQFVAADDAAAGFDVNNLSYRPAAVTLRSGFFDVSFTGGTRVGIPAIRAWRDADPSVVESAAIIPGFGTFLLSVKATALGGGLWRYEYALQNVSSSLAASAFAIPIPPGSAPGEVGFHDVDYHSGDGQDGTDWTATIADGEDAIVFASSGDVPPGSRRNMLAWGTLYNFRFVADAPPGTHEATIILGAPQGPAVNPPASVTISTLTPSVCDGNGVCGPGEDCERCPADCANQGGGGGCCGNGACETGERSASCFADCGAIIVDEEDCGDGFDEDRDGLTDCLDDDCCTSAICDGFDLDGDARGSCDCDDSDPALWAPAAEVQGVTLVGDGLGGAWIGWAPADGAVTASYEVIRSLDPADFGASAACLPLANATDLTVHDGDAPAPSHLFAYLVRARTDCGEGPTGVQSSGTPRIVRSCQ